MALKTDSSSDQEQSWRLDNEKGASTYHSAPAYTDNLPADPDAHLSDEERRAIDKRLMRKIDLRLIPWLSLLYLLSFLDRTNIGNAKLDGLLPDLQLTGPDYNVSLTIFFISYALAEPLTNWLLKRTRPSLFIPGIMVAWGIVMTCMGLVHNYSGLLACRFFLGLAEAGLFPGINYYLSCWYKRSELGTRASVFFSAAAISGSFGGLLAAAISKMAGVGGKDGWAWIFILEGLATIVIAIIAFWMVHDFPETARFLSEEDRARVIHRLRRDNRANSSEEWKMPVLWQALGDWKTYIGMAIYMGADMPLYAFSLFLPTIINELGYASIRAQLLSVPPYAAAAILTVIVGFVADRTGQRGLSNILCSLLGMAGFSMLLAGSSPGLSYSGTFLGALGIYPCIANTVSWVANNTDGVYKRGIVLGMVIGWGNLTGVISSNIYRTADSPRFIPGHATVLAFLTIFLFGGSTLYTLLARRENKIRERGGRDYVIEGKTEEEIEILGDKRPDYRYCV